LAKAYCSRVGTGPFPTEQDNEIGQTIRRTMEEHGGREYGATTGRQRRCGWLDGVALAHTARLSGADSLAVSALDVLSAFDTVKVCTAYQVDGQLVTRFPASAAVLERAEPRYEELAGWRCDISEARRWEDLPPAARDYVRFVEQLAGTPVQFISVGPNRQQMIERTGDD
jgi:adenylosuccinate synthase